jgi:hypothetical protein
MPKLVVEAGNIFSENVLGVNFISRHGEFKFSCNPNKFTSPFKGKFFEDEEIKEFIKFLQDSLKEKIENGQSDLG